MISEAEIAETVDRTVRMFQRRRAPADADDMRQESWRIALESLPRYRQDLDTGGRYLGKAIRVSLGNQVSRWLAAVHVPQSHIMEARNYKAQRSPSENAPCFLNDFTPEMALISAEHGARVRDAIAAALDKDPDKRDIVVALFGLGGAEPKAPETIAAETGINVRKIYRARYEFLQRAKRLKELRNLR